MVRVPQGEWPDFNDDLDAGSLAGAIEQSRAYLRKLPPDRSFRYGQDAYTAAHLLESLDRFGALYSGLGPGKALREALSESFILYSSVGKEGRGEVLFTGYYEPLLHGSCQREAPYQWPLYLKPDDLLEVRLGDFDEALAGRTLKGRVEGNRLVPYYTRRDIDRLGSLDGRGLELVWVDDPVEAFFLHVQGSGRVLLTDGRTLRVGYADANGHAYRSLGRRMLDLGLIKQEELSMQSIRDWLTANPDRMDELLDHNPSYVFFRVLEGDAVGNINVPLTPGRSVALDHRIFPKGALAWIASRRPVVDQGQVAGWTDFSRFVLVQDTGGAIRGPARCDLFFGHGPDAEAAAGRLKEPGRLWFPVLKKQVP